MRLAISAAGRSDGQSFTDESGGAAKLAQPFAEVDDQDGGCRCKARGQPLFAIIWDSSGRIYPKLAQGQRHE